MPASNVAAEKRSQPQILVETAGLSEEEWLAYRRKGIGGSDVAALLGISPWRTARDLYFDKLNIVAVEDNEDNWVALEMGHLLESLVAKIFQHHRVQGLSDQKNVPAPTVFVDAGRCGLFCGIAGWQYRNSGD